MKLSIHLKTLLVSLLTIAFLSLQAQENESSYSNSLDDITSLSDLKNDYLTGMFGLTNIGDETYVGMRVETELNLGKVGIGLDVPVYFNIENGEFWSDSYKNGVGVLRLLTYLRFGRKKKDPVFFKVGELRNERIGYGSLVNNYNNSISKENRKIGTVYDIRIKKIFGIEGLYSDFNAESFNLFAIRPYVRPFARSGIPIVKTIDAGFTYVKDKDQTNRLSGENLPNQYLKKGISALGLDMGITLINSSLINLSSYAQYSKLNKVKSLEETLNAEELANYDSGTGLSVGLNANIRIIGNLFNMNARLERLWYNDNYLPQFFNTTYEIDKDLRIRSLRDAKKQQGIYGSLTASLIDKILINGNLLIPDDLTETSPALLQINMQAVDLFNKIVINGSYTKGNITDLSDALKFDDSSLAVVRFAYKINPYIVAGVDYSWMWVEQENGSFKTENRITPYFGVNIPL